MKSYFQEWKFKHPKGKDFIELAKSMILAKHGNQESDFLNRFFQQAIYEATSVDFTVDEIDVKKNSFTVSRIGDLVIPVDISIEFADQTSTVINWSAQQTSFTQDFPDRDQIISVMIDPENKIPLDLDLNNNSLSLKSSKITLWKLLNKGMFWIQNSLQTISLLF